MEYWVLELTFTKLVILLQELERYIAEVVSMTDYYAFGSIMPKRNDNSDKYRYGFNGMEKDDEVKGNGNSYDFGARIYDPRIGRWLSLDPQSEKYPMLSDYSFVANSPLMIIDPDGETLRVAAQDQSMFLKDLTKTLGASIANNFSFDPKTNELKYVGGAPTFNSTDVEGVYKGIMKVVNDKEVTTVKYTHGPTEPGADDVRDHGGEITITIKDNPGRKENTIYVLKSSENGGKGNLRMNLESTNVNVGDTNPRKLKSVTTYSNEPRANNVIHGIGHVLYQNNADQYKVIDFDNMGRRASGEPERTYDFEHSDANHKPGTK